MFHEKPISPQTLEKNFKDFAVGTLEPEVRTLLKQKKVTPEQYVYWASERFKFQTFLGRIGTYCDFRFIFFKIALDMGVEKEAAFGGYLGWRISFHFDSCLEFKEKFTHSIQVFTMIFRFYGLGLLRFTLKYVQNRSEETSGKDT